jgi:hypothetical protein
MERRRHGERICEGVHGDLGDREPLDRAVEMADALSGSASIPSHGGGADEDEFSFVEGGDDGPVFRGLFNSHAVGSSLARHKAYRPLPQGPLR